MPETAENSLEKITIGGKVVWRSKRKVKSLRPKRIKLKKKHS